MPELSAEMRAEIERIATGHGKAAASWAFDGNTSRETYEAARKGIDDGDPMVMDGFRVPDLSGKFSDDYDDRALACDLDIPEDEHDTLDEAATEYLAVVNDAYWAEIERMINIQLAPEPCTCYGAPVASGCTPDC